MNHGRKYDRGSRRLRSSVNLTAIYHVETHPQHASAFNAHYLVPAQVTSLCTAPGRQATPGNTCPSSQRCNIFRSRLSISAISAQLQRWRMSHRPKLPCHCCCRVQISHPKKSVHDPDTKAVVPSSAAPGHAIFVSALTVRAAWFLVANPSHKLILPMSGACFTQGAPALRPLLSGVLSSYPSCPLSLTGCA